MGVSTGGRLAAEIAPATTRPSTVPASSGSLRAQLDDPSFTVLAIGLMTLITLLLVRASGGAPSAAMELGYAPVALAAYVFGRRGGLAAGIVVGAALGPLPALLGFDRVEGPGAWLIRITAFAGIGVLIGQMLERSQVEVGRARARVADVVQRERESLIALATAAESRDGDAGGHIRRLELTSRRLAEAAGMDARAAANLATAAMLHDIGKLRVPEHILTSTAALTADEWAVIRLHPIWGEQALTGGEHLAVAREVARSHHENWDGSGYPDGLYGDRIPLAARIVRITDTFDAMTNRRPYQPPVSMEAALEEIQANAGRDFDPDLVRAFGELIRADPSLRSRLTELRRS
jgi:hypothetical protein